ncbi:MAG: hypothetical protein RLY43_2472 [Bacteroidota bacterium]|jgi:hypothetical protein
MKKISTLYKKDPNDLSRVINEIAPENKWVIDGEGIPTRKFDGTATAIINGELYKRYDVKRGKQVPQNAIPCQEPDEITGHWPHWIKCDRNNPADKWHFVGFDKLTSEVLPELIDGTYELCGEKIQGNPEKIQGTELIIHGCEILDDCTDLSFDGLKNYLSNSELDIEGIVFHHKNDGRMCKIRKCDFGIKRDVL